jgi:hypothetical protein
MSNPNNFQDLMRNSSSTRQPYIVQKEEEVSLVPPKKRQTVLFKRDDLDPSVYGVQRIMSGFQLHNIEVIDWLSSFSKHNQLNGGCTITKSTLLEVILDVVYYEMNVQPHGFQSPHDLRDYLMTRIK